MLGDLPVRLPVPLEMADTGDKISSPVLPAERPALRASIGTRGWADDRGGGRIEPPEQSPEDMAGPGERKFSPVLTDSALTKRLAILKKMKLDETLH